ncbi:MAG TPA: spore germination protein [Bacilli bacterium]|nr:spore germination protein [Bacilli bacterium]
MPSLIGGPIKIVSVAGGTVNFGDTGVIAPKSASKSYSGAGGGLTGDFSVSINGISNTNTLDPDVIDDNTTTMGV